MPKGLQGFQKGHKDFVSKEGRARTGMKIRGNKWLLGRKHSSETRLKMSMAHKGKKLTLEHRKNLALANRGSKSKLWKGGLTPLVKLLRKTLIYSLWRQSIFERDNFTCVICCKRGGNIEADHFPQRFADLVRDNNIKTYEEAEACVDLWKIDLGRTLCVPCHRKTPTYGQKLEKINYYKSKLQEL